MSLRNKINLSLIIFSLLSVALVVFVIYPLFSGIKEASLALISQRSALISFEIKVEKLERFRTLYQEIKPNLERVNSLLVNPEVPVKFITFLETTAQDCGISIEIFPVSSGKIAGDPWPFLSFQISSVGSFPKFSKFVEKLENSSYLIQIQTLKINKLTESELRTEELESFSLKDVRAILLIKVFTK